ncbi:hypothetical protein PDJAM_G00056130 [Pangasius djambal]|uniref:Uncharacterized protein n=1 Tax=Pangasius djambal TaxID=1691987 RepID=A0ACC5YXQ6_9TELE|nr:hypothetical protein [Pangasius djambal]
MALCRTLKLFHATLGKPCLHGPCCVAARGDDAGLSGHVTRAREPRLAAVFGNTVCSGQYGDVHVHREWTRT